MVETKKQTNGNKKARKEHKEHALDPIYDLPVIGSIVREADALRTKIQGAGLTRKEADLLRSEARALRHVANYLETRAVQLERLMREREGGTTPRVTRIHVESGP